MFKALASAPTKEEEIGFSEVKRFKIIKTMHEKRTIPQGSDKTEMRWQTHPVSSIIYNTVTAEQSQLSVWTPLRPVCTRLHPQHTLQA